MTDTRRGGLMYIPFSVKLDFVIDLSAPDFHAALRAVDELLLTVANDTVATYVDALTATDTVNGVTHYATAISD